ncbi:MAG: hypothetical protein GXP33_04560 [Spirochaetes bacterium]|nr:hypothetical protein [Spirochaetota bacterium]
MQTENIPDIFYEKFILDELPLRRYKELLKAENTDKKITGLKESNSVILDKYPPEIICRSIKMRLKEKRKLNKLHILFPFFYSRKFLLVITAVFVLSFIGIIQIKYAGVSAKDSVKSGIETTRIKGLSPYIKIYKETKNGPVLLGNNSLVKINDILQLSYNSAGYRYGIIFSIDGNGTISLHFPEADTASALLKTGMEVPLPYAYELDDAPYFERFFLVTSNSGINVDKFLKYAKKLSLSRVADKDFNLNLPKGFRQSSILLKKGSNQNE